MALYRHIHLVYVINKWWFVKSKSSRWHLTDIYDWLWQDMHPGMHFEHPKWDVIDIMGVISENVHPDIYIWCIGVNDLAN